MQGWARAGLPPPRLDVRQRPRTTEGQNSSSSCVLFVACLTSYTDDRDAQDLVKGIEAFKEGCAREDANSCNRVASLYLSTVANSPIARDPVAAKNYLELACDANFAPACHNLAVMFKNGDKGVPKDAAKFEEYSKRTKELIAMAGGVSTIKAT